MSFGSINLAPFKTVDRYTFISPYITQQPDYWVKDKAVKNNKKTAYISGEIGWHITTWGRVTQAEIQSAVDDKYYVYTASPALSQKSAVQYTLDDNNGYLAILAVPRLYGNIDYSLPLLNNETEAKRTCAFAAAQLQAGQSINNNLYTYLLISKSTKTGNIFNMRGTYKKNNNYLQDTLFASLNNYPPYSNKPKNDKYSEAIKSKFNSNYSVGVSIRSYFSPEQTINSGYLQKINQIAKDRANVEYYKGYKISNYYNPKDIYNNDMLTIINDTIVSKDFDNTYVSPFTPYNAINAQTMEQPNAIAIQLDTNLPIFIANKNGLEQLANYLNARKYTADNDDDLKMSELDINTDWTIYVKGARKPNIYITEISKGIEDFIKSDANTTGLTAKDFKIQYRCPFWEENKTESLLWDKTDVTIPFLSQYYDYVYQTSYNDLIHVNYGGDFDIEAVQDMAFDMSNPAEMPYAQMQFRIYLNDKKYSSWCEFGIGYIGSPTITDFDKQSNWGIVKGINDGSTVTIIYDEYPEGYAPDDYTKPPDDSDPDITDNGGTQAGTTNNGLSLLTTSYAVTDANLKELGNFLWTATIFDDIRLINNSPLDNIVSVKIMPIGLTGSSVSLKIGNIDTEINAEKIDSVPLLTVGSLEWRGYYGNFLDYAPYTQAYIFLPFIGFYEIDPVQCVGHELTVKYAFDIIVGQCKAFLFVDNIYYTSFEGQCGVDVPLVSTNRAQLESGLLASTVTSVLTANPLPLIMQAINSQYQSQRSGAYSATLGWAETRRCFVVFMIPNSQYPRSYGHDYGYPCNLTYNLGQLSGFTQTIQDPDISGIPCTKEEGEMIKSMLSSGVYL